MTPIQFKQARLALGLSASDLSDILACTVRTINRWEDGSRKPDPLACRILDWLADGTRPADLLTPRR